MEDGPVLAVPVPVGGRLPALEEGAGVLDCVSMGGSLGAVEAWVVETVDEMGPVGTPATVCVWRLGIAFSSANALYHLD